MPEQTPYELVAEAGRLLARADNALRAAGENRVNVFRPVHEARVAANKARLALRPDHPEER